MEAAAYGVFDGVKFWSRTFVQADSEPRVWCHDKQWRLRFVVAPTEHLRINFEVAPKSDASLDSRRYRRKPISKPDKPLRDKRASLWIPGTSYRLLS